MSSDTLDDLPHTIHATVWTRSAARVMGHFKAAGWSWRNSAWDEFEVTCDGAELDIASKHPVLISGGIAQSPKIIERIAGILSGTCSDFELEVYDEHDELVTARAHGR